MRFPSGMEDCLEPLEPSQLRRAVCSSRKPWSGPWKSPREKPRSLPRPGQTKIYRSRSFVCQVNAHVRLERGCRGARAGLGLADAQAGRAETAASFDAGRDRRSIAPSRGGAQPSSPAAQQHSSTVGDKLCFFSSGLEQKAASAAAGRALESKLSKLSEPGKSNSNSKQISTLLEVRVVLSELTGRRPVPAPEKGSRNTD